MVRKPKHSMTRKPKIKLRPYELRRLIEEGVHGGLEGGWYKAHKYEDRPKPERIWERQLEYVMLNLDERFDLK